MTRTTIFTLFLALTCLGAATAAEPDFGEDLIRQAESTRPAAELADAFRSTVLDGGFRWQTELIELEVTAAGVTIDGEVWSWVKTGKMRSAFRDVQGSPCLWLTWNFGVVKFHHHDLLIFEDRLIFSRDARTYLLHPELKSPDDTDLSLENRGAIHELPSVIHKLLASPLMRRENFAQAALRHGLAFDQDPMPLDGELAGKSFIESLEIIEAQNRQGTSTKQDLDLVAFYMAVADELPYAEVLALVDRLNTRFCRDAVLRDMVERRAASLSLQQYLALREVVFARHTAVHVASAWAAAHADELDEDVKLLDEMLAEEKEQLRETVREVIRQAADRDLAQR